MSSDVPEQPHQSTPGASISLEDVLVMPPRLTLDPSSLRPGEQSLLALTDGRRTVAELLRVSGMPGFVMMRLLRSMCERGILVTTTPPSSGPSPLSNRTARTDPFNPDGPRTGATKDLTKLVGQVKEMLRATPNAPIPGSMASLKRTQEGTAPMLPVQKESPPAARGMVPARTPGTGTKIIGHDLGRRAAALGARKRGPHGHPHGVPGGARPARVRGAR